MKDDHRNTPEFILQPFSLNVSHVRNNIPNIDIDFTDECRFETYYEYFFDVPERSCETIITLPEKYIPLLMEILRIGHITRRVPKTYTEEINAIVNELPPFPSSKSQEKGWFVRSDTASLKYGKHGNKPYTNWLEIIESIVTCRNTHHPITTPFRLYFLPYVRIINEFRVFIYESTIVGISVSNIYCVSETILFKKRRGLLDAYLTSLVSFVETVLERKPACIRHTAMDIAELDDYTFYFVEMNKYDRSGSAGFDWNTDTFLCVPRERDTPIPFRYVTDE